ncbi:MAG: phenylacetate-coenzyme A ligase PaaK-like adenylate-forming protein [Luteibaculaceae bacterium]|jgi:phenylacetate-coenzyme A ligase PaaK-like adenylate-forming protein
MIKNNSPYSLAKKEKEAFLTQELNSLFQHHYANCLPFKKSMEAQDYNPLHNYNYYDLPFLPVRLFKLYDLKSIPDEAVFKTLTSSGTSGQTVSRIFLDKESSANQIKTLAKIVSSYTGQKRQAMLIIDSGAVLKNRELFSARGAGILGFSMFGTDLTYGLNDKMELDIEKVKNFIERHKGKPILLFGFTFIVYEYFFKALLESGINLDLSNAILIHGGGWKKMISASVTPDVFKENLNAVCNITKIYDYYGMVEQTGTVYMECDEGVLHASDFSDIIIRREKDFSVASFHEKGIIQVISTLPKSYPGQSLLTEDEGYILGEDDCKCGKKGKYFKITGRIKNAELRGCSDTYGN